MVIDTWEDSLVVRSGLHFFCTVYPQDCLLEEGTGEQKIQQHYPKLTPKTNRTKRSSCVAFRN